MVAESDGASDAGAFHHMCVPADVDRTILEVEHRAFHFGSLFEEDHWITVAVSHGANHMVGVGEGLRDTVGRDAAEVFNKHLRIEEENIVDKSEATDVFLEDIKKLTCLKSLPRAQKRERAFPVHYGLTRLQGDYAGRDVGIRNHGTGDEEHFLVMVIGLPEAWTEVFYGESVDLGFREEGGPFLTDGGDAHAEVADGAREGEREEIEMVLQVVEENEFHMVVVVIGAVVVVIAAFCVQN